MVKRTDRLNSLLKEVISEVIRRDLHHAPFIDEFVTITRVDITSDLSYAKVYISVIGDDKKKKQALSSLQDRARPIALIARKKVTMRLFPVLDFVLDHDLEKQLHMEELLHKISEERAGRTSDDSSSDA
jgi:ribosome-binding factor A